MGGFKHCGTLDDTEKVKQVEQFWNVSAICFDGMSFLINDGVIVLSFDNGDLAVYVAAYNEDKLRDFEKEINIEIDYLWVKKQK